MVRFVATAYTHMYDNEYLGQPDDNVRRKFPEELSSVGALVERWRKKAGVSVDKLCERVRLNLGPRCTFNENTYMEFVRGNIRIDTEEIRTVAAVLGTTVHNMTHFRPGQEPTKKERPKQESLVILSYPESEKKGTRRQKSVQKSGSKSEHNKISKPASDTKPYDADEAARLLAQKFGDKVIRAKK